MSNKSVEDIKGNYLKDCSCGCGTKIWHIDDHYRIRNFAYHHSTPKCDKNHFWKTGKTKDKRGYIRILKPEHHFARGGYVPEHRLVWEQANRASLLPWGDVHHKNRIKDDNRPDNLEAMIHGSHSKHHSDEHIGLIGIHRIRKTEDLGNSHIRRYRRLWHWLFRLEKGRKLASFRG